MPVASLTHTTPICVYDVSAGGCLLESLDPLPVGTVGLLTMDLDGRTRHEWVRVCRVHADERRRGQMSVEFLPLGPAGVESLRGAVLRLRPVGRRSHFPTSFGRSSGDPGKSMAGAGPHAASSSPRAPAVHADLPSSSPVIELATPLLESAAAGAPEARKGVVQMKALVVRLFRNDEGQDLIEYVLIGTLVSVAVVIGATALGTNLNTWYQNMANWVQQNSNV